MLNGQKKKKEAKKQKLGYSITTTSVTIPLARSITGFEPVTELL